VRLELRHLRVVVTVAAEGSIGSAAARLRVSQPALTGQLRRIEDEIGGELFTRHRGGVEPTDLGRYVVRQARRQLDRFDELRATAQGLTRSRPDTAPLRLGGTDSLLAPLLADAARTLTGQEATSRFGAAGEPILSALADHELDLAQLHEWSAFPLAVPPGIDQRTLVTEPEFVALPAAHRLAGRPEVELADLAEADWVLLADGDTGRLVTFRLACADAGFTPRAAHHAAEDTTVAGLVTAGLACGLWHPTIRPPPGVTVRPLARNPCSRRLLLAWPTASPAASRAAAIRTRVLAGYLGLVRGTGAYASWWAGNGSGVLLRRGA
jgi:DNA-binding transcriptional LysR family regulator